MKITIGRLKQLIKEQVDEIKRDDKLVIVCQNIDVQLEAMKSPFKFTRKIEVGFGADGEQRGGFFLDRNGNHAVVVDLGDGTYEICGETPDGTELQELEPNFKSANPKKLAFQIRKLEDNE